MKEPMFLFSVIDLKTQIPKFKVPIKEETLIFDSQFGCICLDLNMELGSASLGGNVAQYLLNAIALINQLYLRVEKIPEVARFDISRIIKGHLKVLTFIMFTARSEDEIAKCAEMFGFLNSREIQNEIPELRYLTNADVESNGRTLGSTNYNKRVIIMKSNNHFSIVRYAEAQNKVFSLVDHNNLVKSSEGQIPEDKIVRLDNDGTSISSDGNGCQRELRGNHEYYDGSLQEHKSYEIIRAETVKNNVQQDTILELRTSINKQGVLLNRKIQDVSDQLDKVQKNVGDELSSLKEYIDKKINQINMDISNISSKLDQTNADLNRKIDHLKADMNNISNKVDQTNTNFVHMLRLSA